MQDKLKPYEQCDIELLIEALRGGKDFEYACFLCKRAAVYLESCESKIKELAALASVEGV